MDVAPTFVCSTTDELAFRYEKVFNPVNENGQMCGWHHTVLK